MTHEDYQQAAGHWIKKDAEGVKMPQEELKAAVEEFILAHDTCALATGSGSFVRCTPIEYTYRDGAFWMFTEGGLKFTALETNKNVCLAIFHKYEGFGRLKGMQVTGTAELVEPFSPEYNAAAASRKIPPETMKKLGFVMNLLRISPAVIDFLNTDFKAKGYNSRQQLTQPVPSDH
mgnify:CR=1 FL=1